MSDFTKTFDQFIESARQHEKQSGNKTQRWKFCVALSVSGWKVKKWNRIEPSSDIMVIWEKSGKKDIEIRLPYNDQCLWLEYAQQKESNEQK